MITRVLAGAAIAVAAAVGLAAPAIADPNPFGDINCAGCQQPDQKPGSPAPSPDQTTAAIQQGYAAMKANLSNQ